MSSKNKELQLFHTDSAANPFSIEAVNAGLVRLKAPDNQVIEFVCQDVKIATAVNQSDGTATGSSQSVKESLDTLENPLERTALTNVTAPPGLSQPESTPNGTSGTIFELNRPVQKLDYKSLNTGLMDENHRAVVAERNMWHLITDSNNTAIASAAGVESPADELYNYDNINLAVKDETIRAMKTEADIVALRYGAQNDGLSYVPDASFRTAVSPDSHFQNINDAYQEVNHKMLQRTNYIMKTKVTPDKDQDLMGTSVNTDNITSVKANFEYFYFNDGLAAEHRRAIDKENEIKEFKTKAEKEDDLLFPVIFAGMSGEQKSSKLNNTLPGKFINLNDAFCFENHRAIKKEWAMSKAANTAPPQISDNDNYKLFAGQRVMPGEASEQLTSVETPYRVISKLNVGDASGNDEWQETIVYNYVENLNYENHNEAVLAEHRRAVKVENEINQRVDMIMRNTTAAELDSLAELVQMFTSGDLKLTRNLQEFSGRYNALVNDFNILSASHKDLIDRFNQTFDSVDDADLNFSKTTRAAITFNVNTGLVNSSLRLTDAHSDADWNRSSIAEAGGVYTVATSQLNRELCLPTDVTLVSTGATLIVRRVDVGTNTQPVKVIWHKGEATQTSAILAENYSEVVFLGTQSGWLPLKPAAMKAQVELSSAWTVSANGDVSETVGIGGYNNLDASGNNPVVTPVVTEL